MYFLQVTKSIPGQFFWVGKTVLVRFFRVGKTVHVLVWFFWVEKNALVHFYRDKSYDLSQDSFSGSADFPTWKNCPNVFFPGRKNCPSAVSLQNNCTAGKIVLLHRDPSRALDHDMG